MPSPEDGMDELEEIRERKRQELMKALQQGRPVDLTDATLEEFVREDGLAAVDCWAPWCGPCRAMGPVVEKLAAELAGTVRFGKLNTDENPRTSDRFQIDSIPTFLIFRDGRLVKREMGSMPQAELKRRILAHSQ